MKKICDCGILLFREQDTFFCSDAAKQKRQLCANCLCLTIFYHTFWRFANIFYIYLSRTFVSLLYILVMYCYIALFKRNNFSVFSAFFTIFFFIVSTNTAPQSHKSPDNMQQRPSPSPIQFLHFAQDELSIYSPEYKKSTNRSSCFRVKTKGISHFAEFLFVV